MTGRQAGRHDLKPKRKAEGRLKENLQNQQKALGTMSRTEG